MIGRVVLAFDLWSGGRGGVRVYDRMKGRDPMCCTCTNSSCSNRIENREASSGPASTAEQSRDLFFQNDHPFYYHYVAFFGPIYQVSVLDEEERKIK